MAVIERQGKFPFLCNHCGRLLDKKSEADSIAKYNVWPHYMNYINSKPDNMTINFKNGKSLTREKLIGFMNLADHCFTCDLEPNCDSENNEIKVTIPELTVGSLKKIAETLSNSRLEVVETLKELTSAEELNEKIVERKTVYADVSHGIIKSIGDFGHDADRIERLCPYCKESIKYPSGAFPEKRIGVIGTPRQGKSAILSATVNAFMNRDKYGISFVHEAVMQNKAFMTDYLYRYRNNISIIKT